jgi:hypothetical protein
MCHLLVQERLLSIIFNRTFLLDEKLLRDGTSNQGDPSRLRAALTKLLLGITL